MIGAKTIDLHGEDEHGLCWREIMTPEGYCYGYLNVKKTAKTDFDLAVSTMSRSTERNFFEGEFYSDR